MSDDRTHLTIIDPESLAEAGLAVESAAKPAVRICYECRFIYRQYTGTTYYYDKCKVFHSGIERLNPFGKCESWERKVPVISPKILRIAWTAALSIWTIILFIGSL